MIRDIKFEVFPGVVDEAPKQFHIMIFVKFRKTPIDIWLRSDETIADIVVALLDVVRVLIQKDGDF